MRQQILPIQARNAARVHIHTTPIFLPAASSAAQNKFSKIFPSKEGCYIVLFGKICFLFILL
ncbi:hypothetical protein DWUX_1175 [Desulfovibrio diazotrophicus]|nr:hypothetical protein DWUX_1175 [Desulfovibrio diazotrophicus]